MNRRQFITFACSAALACPLAANAQQSPPNVPIIGWLRVLPEQGGWMREQLAARALVDGHHVRLDVRQAEGKIERLPELAKSLVRDGAAVIVAFGPVATRAAQAATSTIPIVAGADLVSEGLVANMTRPEGNITGVSLFNLELYSKRIEQLKKLLPDVQHVGVLNDGTMRAAGRRPAMAVAGRNLGLKLAIVDVTRPADLETAFHTFHKEGAAAVSVCNSTLFASLKREIGELSHKYRIPVICEWRYMAETDCLASYGITIQDALAVDYVDRTLRGAKPADLPVVHPKGALTHSRCRPRCSSRQAR